VSKYFVLEWDWDRPAIPGSLVEPYRLEMNPEVVDITWRMGALLTPTAKWQDDRPPVEPIEIAAEPKKEEKGVESVYPELTWLPIPLMTRRLVTALLNAGVHNLQTFETVLTNVEGKNPPPRNHYLAVNVLGLVAAADMKRSKIPPGMEDELISVDFDSLVIDEAKTMDFLMFRLAENTSAVLVHERVKTMVEAAGIDTLSWIPPERWAG
jgi:hypothetical protein